LIYTAERTKRDLGEKISKDNVDRIDKAVTELREALSGKETEKVKVKTEALSKVLQEISAAVYQQAAQQSPQQQSTQTEGTREAREEKEKVVDADYKVVDENKK
jgi:molecular chaperone DnaK